MSNLMDTSNATKIKKAPLPRPSDPKDCIFIMGEVFDLLSDDAKGSVSRTFTRAQGFLGRKSVPPTEKERIDGFTAHLPTNVKDWHALLELAFSELDEGKRRKVCERYTWFDNRKDPFLIKTEGEDVPNETNNSGRNNSVPVQKTSVSTLPSKQQPASDEVKQEAPEVDTRDDGGPLNESRDEPSASNSDGKMNDHLVPDQTHHEHIVMTTQISDHQRLEETTENQSQLILGDTDGTMAISTEVNDVAHNTECEALETISTATPRGRGRPKGSKNKRPIAVRRVTFKSPLISNEYNHEVPEPNRNADNAVTDAAENQELDEYEDDLNVFILDDSDDTNMTFTAVDEVMENPDALEETYTPTARQRRRPQRYETAMQVDAPRVAVKRPLIMDEIDDYLPDSDGSTPFDSTDNEHAKKVPKLVERYTDSGRLVKSVFELLPKPRAPPKKRAVKVPRLPAEIYRQSREDILRLKNCWFNQGPTNALVQCLRACRILEWLTTTDVDVSSKKYKVQAALAKLLTPPFPKTKTRNTFALLREMQLYWKDHCIQHERLKEQQKLFKAFPNPGDVMLVLMAQLTKERYQKAQTYYKLHYKCTTCHKEFADRTDCFIRDVCFDQYKADLKLDDLFGWDRPLINFTANEQKFVQLQKTCRRKGCFKRADLVKERFHVPDACQLIVIETPLVDVDGDGTRIQRKISGYEKPIIIDGNSWTLTAGIELVGDSITEGKYKAWLRRSDTKWNVYENLEDRVANNLPAHLEGIYYLFLTRDAPAIV